VLLIEPCPQSSFYSFNVTFELLQLYIYASRAVIYTSHVLFLLDRPVNKRTLRHKYILSDLL
jgi:hypothetical protein